MPVAGDRHGREDWRRSRGGYPKDSAQDPYRGVRGARTMNPRAVPYCLEGVVSGHWWVGGSKKIGRVRWNSLPERQARGHETIERRLSSASGATAASRACENSRPIAARCPRVQSELINRSRCAGMADASAVGPGRVTLRPSQNHRRPRPSRSGRCTHREIDDDRIVRAIGLAAKPSQSRRVEWRTWIQPCNENSRNHCGPVLHGAVLSSIAANRIASWALFHDVASAIQRLRGACLLLGEECPVLRWRAMRTLIIVRIIIR